MRKAFVFLLFFVFPLTCFANKQDFADADFKIISGKISSDEQKILKGAFNSDEAAVVAEIEKILKDKDPKLVSEMQNKPDDQKIIRYRSRLAELSFDEYEQAFINMLKYRSKETGRELRQKSIVSGCKKMMHYWLDKGELDSSKCKKPEVSSSREYVDWVTKNACFYPDGFEDHYISITRYDCEDWKYDEYGNSNDRASRSLLAVDDYKNKNVRSVYNIDVSTHSKSGVSRNFMEFFLDLTNTSVAYDEYHEWRNQEISDIRAGMYEYDDEVYSDGGFSLYKIDFSKGWKSQNNPMTTVRSITTIYNSSEHRVNVEK